jgi:hypothetical protein
VIQSVRWLSWNWGGLMRLRETRPKRGRDYREFLALWKDADRDIPILKQAQAEYAQLGDADSTLQVQLQKPKAR